MVPNPIIRIGHNINIHPHPKHVQSQSDSSYGSYGSLLYVDDEQTTTIKQQQLNKNKTMKKYKVSYLDKGAQRVDEVYANSPNEAGQRIKDKYGKHISSWNATEIKG